MSIRLRLTLTYSIVLGVILLVFSITVSAALYWTLLSSVDESLDSTVSEIVSNIAPPRLQLAPSGELSLLFRLPPELDIFRASTSYVQIWRDDGTLSSASDNIAGYGQPLDPEALNTTVDTRRNVLIAGTSPLRVFTHPLVAGDRIVGRIQVAQSITTVLDAQKGVTLLMIVIGILALGTSLFLGGGLIERALRPIESIAQAASQIATGDDLSRRIPYNGPPDELGRLTTVFNATLGRLENLFIAQRRFVADVSHELRTPLTVIQGNVDLIRRYGADDDSLMAIGNETRRMTRLVGDLLLLAQADAGELPMLKQNLELDTVLLEVFEQAKILSEGKTTVRLGRFDPVRVYADPDRLKQLLLNLVSNAFKFTPEGGTITLAVWPDGPTARLSVADTGEGIPAEDLPHIFDRFYRVDKARARRQGGAGLGLAIAHWIADAHGGRLTVDSTVGEGTTFTVHLPRQIPPPESLVETVHNIPIPATLKAPAKER
jgi:two-component system OmpR family sensor kinase